MYLSKLDRCAQFEKIVAKFHKNDPAAIRYLFLCEDNIKHFKEDASIENMIL